MTTLVARKPHKDRGIEGLTAKWYAKNTGEMMSQYCDLARRIAGEIAEGSRVLEVAPGPGYFLVELGKLGSYELTGLDISHAMVKIATEKAAQAGVGASFQHGSASNLPFPKGSFDFLLCRAAFKNFAQPVVALREMRRVLSPGGRALIIDLKRDASPAEIDREINAMRLTPINRFLTKGAFKVMLIKSAYLRAEFEQMLAEAGCDRFEIAETGIGLEVSILAPRGALG